MESSVELCVEDIELVEPVVQPGENVAVRAVAARVGDSGHCSVLLAQAVVVGLLWLPEAV
jgi:hypothetical protein